MFVKPAASLRVLDPVHKQPMAPEGREVPDIAYWHRRLRDGDVVLANAEPAASEA
jgi:hypothetical protein